MTLICLLSRKRTNHNLPAALLALFLVCMVSVSCNKKQRCEGAFISGKVLNPRHNTVIFTDFESFNDTIDLNATSEFKVHLRAVKKPGLYTFWHHNEYQSVYLEPGDTLSLFVDSKSFDESLAFSNSHAVENNYLITMFVEMEKANTAFLPQYKKNPEAFVAFIENEAQKQQDKLDEATITLGLSTHFKAIVRDMIKFNTYNKKERYVHAHDGKTAHATALPATFYDHRKNVDLTNTKLLNNNSFKAYLNSLIANKTRERLSDVDEPNGNLYATTRLQVTNELLENETMREVYLTNYTRNVLRNAKDHETPQTILKTYLSLSKDENNHKRMKQFAANFNPTRTGNDLANLLLKTSDDKEVMLGAVVRKPSIIYYWSTKDESYNMQVHHTVAGLRVKYPEFDFIGVNTDYTEDNNWEKALGNMDISIKNEYQVAVENNYNLENILKGSRRAMLIDKDLTIIDGNLNLLHYKIETTLLGYASK